MKKKKGNQKRSRRPLFLISLGVLFMIGASLIWYYLPGDEPETVNPGSPQTRVSDVSEIQRVSVAEARSAQEQNRAVFLDVRSSFEYSESRIPGAISIPLDELNMRAGELNPEDWIITYCT